MKIINASSKFLTEFDTNDAMLKLGKIASVCYKGSKYEETELDKAKRIVGNCIKNHHDSILEHFAVSVEFVTSRDISHELVRHRMASFTQESTRYCNYTNSEKFGGDISVIDISKYIQDCNDAANVYMKWKEACEACEKAYMSMISCGVPAQIARDVLPHSLATTIIVTANLREWRHILKLRTDTVAHPGIQEIMVPVLETFQEKLPIIFGDIEISNAVKERYGTYDKIHISI